METFVRNGLTAGFNHTRLVLGKFCSVAHDFKKTTYFRNKHAKDQHCWDTRKMFSEVALTALTLSLHNLLRI